MKIEVKTTQEAIRELQKLENLQVLQVKRILIEVEMGEAQTDEVGRIREIIKTAPTYIQMKIPVGTEFRGVVQKELAYWEVEPSEEWFLNGLNKSHEKMAHTILQGMGNPSEETEPIIKLATGHIAIKFLKKYGQDRRYKEHRDGCVQVIMMLSTEVIQKVNQIIKTDPGAILDLLDQELVDLVRLATPKKPKIVSEIR